MKKILSIVLAFALFLVPVTTVRAVSLHDVMDQVTSLKTEVAQLKSVVHGKVLGATTTTVISRTLAPGLKNDSDVLKLQVWLNQKGYLAVTPDGNYGPQTTEAVKRFQAANKLTATGTVDYQTMIAINQIVANTPPVIVQPGTVGVDTFLENLPETIELYQKIVKDPETFKSEVIEGAGKLSSRAAHGGVMMCTYNANFGGWVMYVLNYGIGWHYMGTYSSEASCELWGSDMMGYQLI